MRPGDFDAIAQLPRVETTGVRTWEPPDVAWADEELLGTAGDAPGLERRRARGDFGADVIGVTTRGGRVFLTLNVPPTKSRADQDAAAVTAARDRVKKKTRQTPREV